MRTLLAIVLGLVALIALLLLLVGIGSTILRAISQDPEHPAKDAAITGIIFGVIFLVTSCGAILAAPGESLPPEQGSQGGNQDKKVPPSAEATPTPSEAPTPTPSPEPTPEPEEEEPEPEPEPPPEPKVIPNLLPVDVYGNLEDRGFECTGPDSVVDDVMWTCDAAELDSSGEYSVEITGPDASSVKQIQVMALTFTTDAPSSTAIELLGFVATVPYEGSEPARAKAWVEENAGSASEVETEIGGVRYSLAGPVTGRILQMDPT